MAGIDRVWPAEKNVGGVHRTARYAMAPVLLAVGIATLAGPLTVTPGPVGIAVGVGCLIAGIVSLVEAHTQKCPGYAAMGINTCERSAPASAGGPEETA